MLPSPLPRLLPVFFRLMLTPFAPKTTHLKATTASRHSPCVHWPLLRYPASRSVPLVLGFREANESASQAMQTKRHPALASDRRTATLDARHPCFQCSRADGPTVRPSRLCLLASRQFALPRGYEGRTPVRRTTGRMAPAHQAPHVAGQSIRLLSSTAAGSGRRSPLIRRSA